MSDIRSQSTCGKYVIFCVGQDESRIKEFKDYVQVNRVACKELAGKYRGVEEKSFITTEQEYKNIEHWTLEEESILILSEAIHDGARPAILSYGGHEVPIGLFRQCTEGEAKTYDSWTFDPLTGSYYVCK